MKVNTALLASICVVNRQRSSSSHSSVAKKLSHMALSYASPTEPIEGRTPASRQRWPNSIEVYCRDSNGRRNTLKESCDDEAQAAFGSVWSGAIVLTRSPGGGRADQQRRFWAAIAAGMASEDAAVQAGMSQAVGRIVPTGRRDAPACSRPSPKPLSGRYLSLRSARRSHCFECRVCSIREDGRRLDEPPQRSARLRRTLRPAAAAWSIACVMPNGTLSDRPVGRNPTSCVNTTSYTHVEQRPSASS